MQANQKQFLRFLEGADTHFVVPVYQRNYDWTKEQCEQLFGDLIDISRHGFRTHFIGSIVSIYNNDKGNREYLIIDGQQRITTLSILLQAIYKGLDGGVFKSQDDRLKEKIEDYLVNRHVEDDKRIRLKPIKDDAEAFSKLFGNKKHFIDNSNITINFWYFYNRILNEKVSIDDLFLAIKNLIIVEIELKNGEDDPQLIFESLNSTGLDLSEADKVRNFILMKEDTETQNRFYEDYWNVIEKNTNFDVSNFIRDYLTLKERVIPNKNRVYLSFKKFVLEQEIDIEEILKDLLKFSEYYKKIIYANNDSRDSVDRIIYRLNKLETMVSYPFLLEIFNDNNDEIITYEELSDILKVIESFVLRRFICDVPTNALNKIFMILGKEIKKHKDYKKNYFDIFRYILTKKDLNQRFPDDKEFQDKIVLKDIYNLKSKNKVYLLEQLENYNNREKVRVEELVGSNELTIEHIMPQTLTPDWKKELGEDWMEIYEKYLHTLGNITLTAYNSEYSNRSFIEKRDMEEKGFRDSRLFLNKYLSTIERWNEKNIKERARKLLDRALKIWKYPSTEYKPKKDMDKIFTLADDEITFTGKMIVSFSYGEYEDYKVGTWKKFYELVAKELYKTNPNIFINSLKNTSIKNKISSNKDDSYLPIEISKKLYLKADMSTEFLLFTLRKIIEKFDINPAEITFTIK